MSVHGNLDMELRPKIILYLMKYIYSTCVYIYKIIYHKLLKVCPQAQSY